MYRRIIQSKQDLPQPYKDACKLMTLLESGAKKRVSDQRLHLPASKNGFLLQCPAYVTTGPTEPSDWLGRDG